RLEVKNRESEEYKNFTSLVFVAKEPALELDFKGAKSSIDGLIKRLARKFI
ncbi:ribonuclease P protein component, partial [Candidatus Gastranaerophilus sp. (ex Termes propinquus)]